jgi:hypothetical protein
MQALDRLADLFAHSRAQNRVSHIEAVSSNHLARDGVIRTQQLARYGSEHAKAEPRQCGLVSSSRFFDAVRSLRFFGPPQGLSSGLGRLEILPQASGAGRRGAP